jgi:hypothetical protein
MKQDKFEQIMSDMREKYKIKLEEIDYDQIITKNR